MPKRKIVTLLHDETWNQYLIQAFDDTPSTPEIVRTTEEALPLIRMGNPDVVFVQAALLTKPLVAALHANRASNANFRAFCVGENAGSAPYPFDETFDGIPPRLYDFQKKLVDHLPLPDSLRLLVVDNEPEIREAFRDYFDRRIGPAFIVETAQDGLEGERQIQKARPDVLVLDIKLPEKNGLDLYRDLRAKGIHIPTVIYFHLVSADEVIEARKLGNPALVEKSSQSGSMSALASLIKKLAYFG